MMDQNSFLSGDATSERKTDPRLHFKAVHIQKGLRLQTTASTRKEILGLCSVPVNNIPKMFHVHQC